MEKKASRKKTAHYFIAICSGLILGITTIFGFLNLDKSSDAVSGDIIEGITKLMLPDNPTVYEKTTQTVEEFELKKDHIYHFEVYGGRGGVAFETTSETTTNEINGIAGNGSYAHGWYESNDNFSITVFAGGKGSGKHNTASIGWSATELNPNFQGTRGGISWLGELGGGGGGGGASGIYAGATPLLVAGGGGGGGAAGKNSSYKDMNGGDGGGENGGNGQGDLGGFGATQSSHGVRGGNSKPGTDSGGGNADNIQSGNPGGGAGGGWTRGYAGSSGTYYGTFMGSPTLSSGPGGGGSGGASYTGGVKSLSDNPKGFEWAHPEANDNGKVRITEYMMGYSAGVPNSTADYTVSAPSKTLVTSGESYTFTITRTSGTGHIGLVLNSGNGILELTSIDGSVFTYTVSNVQGSISAEDFSVTTFNVNAPPNGIGYIISAPSSTNVIRGGSYTFVVELDAGYACPIVTLNSTNGKINYSSVINNKMTITISNVLGEIFAEDFTVLVSKLT